MGIQWGLRRDAAYHVPSRALIFLLRDQETDKDTGDVKVNKQRTRGKGTSKKTWVALALSVKEKPHAYLLAEQTLFINEEGWRPISRQFLARFSPATVAKKRAVERKDWGDNFGTAVEVVMKLRSLPVMPQVLGQPVWVMGAISAQDRTAAATGRLAWPLSVFYPLADADLHVLLEKVPAAQATVDIRCRLSRDLIIGMDHLHARNLWHGDLKAENVLIKARRAFVADLDTFKMSWDKGDLYHGTCPYMPPEIVRRSQDVGALIKELDDFEYEEWANNGFFKSEVGANAAADAWSLGLLIRKIVAWDLREWSHGFYGLPTDYLLSLANTRPLPAKSPDKRSDAFSNMAYAVANRLLAEDPRQRWTVRQARQAFDKFLASEAAEGLTSCRAEQPSAPRAQ